MKHNKVLSGCENGCSDAGCPLARGCVPQLHGGGHHVSFHSHHNGGSAGKYSEKKDHRDKTNKTYAYNRPSLEVCFHLKKKNQIKHTLTIVRF